MTITLLSVVGLNVYNTLAVPGPFTIPKPYTATLVPEVVFTVDSITFDYNTATKIYDDADVTVRNTHSSQGFAGNVIVTLYDSLNAAVSSGSNTFSTVAAGMTTAVTVSLSWISAKTVADVVNGTIQVIAA